MLLLLASLLNTAHAGVPDMYGSGVRYMGMGGGGIGLVDDGNAARINPAGLGFVDQPTVGLGVTSAFHRFDPIPDLYWDTNRDGVLDDRDAALEFPSAVDDAAGFQVYAGRNIGGKFGIGLNAYVPTKRVIRFETFEPRLPNYLMYSNRPQRFSAAAGVGGQILPGVSIGASVEVLAAAHLNLFMTLDAGFSGDSDSGEELVGDIVITVHEASLDVVPQLAPIIGAQIDVGEWLPALEGVQVGGVIRGSTGLPITANLDIQANIAIEDVGDLEPYILAAIIDGKLSMIDHYVPPYIAIGGAYHRPEGMLSVYGDMRLTSWQRFKINIADLDTDNSSLTTPLVDLNDRLVDGNDFVAPQWRNTVQVNGGAEVRLPKWEFDTRWQYAQLSLRGGFAYIPSPLLGQSSETAFLDSDRTMLTLGAGLEHHDPFELVDAPVRYDLMLQYNLLSRGSLPRSSDEPTAGYPVDVDFIPYGGSIVVIGAQWGFDF